MKSPAFLPAKRRHGGGGFALGCGCKDAKSVSVSGSASAATATSTTGTVTPTRRSRLPWASTTTDTVTSASSLWEDAVAELGYKDGGCRILPAESGGSVVTTPSFSGLLRELGELERSVAAWGGAAGKQSEGKLSPMPRHEKAKAAGDLMTMRAARYREARRSGDDVGLDGSVAVVKQSEDPLGDFRRSMLQMIVEKGIVGGEGLREMLRRFLTLNAPHHHDAILRAFADIWDQLFVVPRREPRISRTPPRHRRTPPEAWRV